MYFFLSGCVYFGKRIQSIIAAVTIAFIYNDTGFFVQTHFSVHIHKRKCIALFFPLNQRGNLVVHIERFKFLRERSDGKESVSSATSDMCKMFVRSITAAVKHRSTLHCRR